MRRISGTHFAIFVGLFLAIGALAGRPAVRTACGTVLDLGGGSLCLLPPVQADVGASLPQGEVADLVLTGGIIYTGDPARPRAQALAIKGDRILAIGSAEQISRHIGKATRVTDLKGRFAMPGFNDAHVHLANGGQAKLAIDFTGAASLAEFQQRIRARLTSYQPGEWITGRGWDHTLWPAKKFPTRYDLDAVSKEHPMLFSRVDGHVAVANSLALQLAGITRETKNPAGGEIERDANGEPTGMLKEGAAIGMVSRKIPPRTAEQRRRGIELALAEAVRNGVTSIQDNSGWEDFLIYRELYREGKLPVRISEWLPFTAPVERLKQMQAEGGVSDPMLRTAGLKGVVDGALGGRTAALLAPYSDEPSTSGILILEAERLKQMVIERDGAGFQINLHAIGDRANRVALDAFEAARKANGVRDSRHRIEHTQVLAREDIPRLAALGVIASMQPCHQTTDSRWAGERLGPERSKGAYAWKSLLNAGTWLAFGTDYPVEPINPMRGLYACVTREVDGRPGSTWGPQEKISLDACIEAYTAGSAYAEFQENQKGRLVPGQLADIIVLSADITQIPAAQILKTEVLLALVGGKTVFEKK